MVLFSVVTVVSIFISVVFRQSQMVSVFIAKLLVNLALSILRNGKGWNKNHSSTISKMSDEWYLLKKRLRNEKIGLG